MRPGCSHRPPRPKIKPSGYPSSSSLRGHRRREGRRRRFLFYRQGDCAPLPSAFRRRSGGRRPVLLAVPVGGFGVLAGTGSRGRHWPGVHRCWTEVGVRQSQHEVSHAIENAVLLVDARPARSEHRRGFETTIALNPSLGRLSARSRTQEWCVAMINFRSRLLSTVPTSSRQSTQCTKTNEHAV